MQLKEEEIQSLVREIVRRLEPAPSGAAPSPAVPPSSPQAQVFFTKPGVVHPSVDSAVAAAKKAQLVFQEMGLEARHKIIAAIRKAGVDHAEPLAKQAHQETGLGRWED